MTNEPTLAEQLRFSASDARMFSQVALDLIDAGELEGAATVFIGLLALNPKDASIRAALGTVRHEQGRFTEAEEEYSRAIAIDPGTLVARVNRGELRMRRGDRGGEEDLDFVASSDSSLTPKAQQLLERFSC